MHVKCMYVYVRMSASVYIHVYVKCMCMCIDCVKLVDIITLLDYCWIFLVFWISIRLSLPCAYYQTSQNLKVPSLCLHVQKSIEEPTPKTLPQKSDHM